MIKLFSAAFLWMRLVVWLVLDSIKKKKKPSLPLKLPLLLYYSSEYIVSFRLIFSCRGNCRAATFKISLSSRSLSLTCCYVLSQGTAALTLHPDPKGSCVPADCKSLLRTLPVTPGPCLSQPCLPTGLSSPWDLPFSFLFSGPMASVKCDIRYRCS